MIPEWNSSSPMKMNMGMASSTKLVFCSQTILPKMSSARSRPSTWVRPTSPDRPRAIPTHTPAASSATVIANVMKIGGITPVSLGRRIVAQQRMETQNEAADRGQTEDGGADQHGQHRNPERDHDRRGAGGPAHPEV